MASQLDPVLPPHKRGATFGCVLMLPYDLTGHTLTATIEQGDTTVDLVATMAPPAEIDPFYIDGMPVQFSFVDVEVDAGELDGIDFAFARFDLRAEDANGRVLYVPTISNKIEYEVTKS